MRMRATLAVLAVVSGLCAAPALADPPPDHAKSEKPAKGATGAQGPDTKAGPPSGAKAYGRYCATESRKHLAGEKGTPFSRCVTAMAKLGSGKTDSPKAACSGMSKKHTAGEKGTPFSRCVSAGAKLLAGKSSG